MLSKLLLVFVGGGLGSLLRFAIATYVTSKLESSLSFGTLIVNLLGSLLLGLLLGFSLKNEAQNWWVVPFLMVGFCGGFTTFSTFAVENINLLRDSNLALAFGYSAMSVLGGVGAAFLGVYLVR